ncbi:hypothetical protein K438DRAFT_1945345 [Mycena galopus ATCC 62051]|nr:hypothetical protein K438DRAFT_1945345 [Mycena galopus ATCC 62051]
MQNPLLATSTERLHNQRELRRNVPMEVCTIWPSLLEQGIFMSQRPENKTEGNEGGGYGVQVRFNTGGLGAPNAVDKVNVDVDSVKGGGQTQMQTQRGPEPQVIGIESRRNTSSAMPPPLLTPSFMGSRTQEFESVFVWASTSSDDEGRKQKMALPSARACAASGPLIRDASSKSQIVSISCLSFDKPNGYFVTSDTLSLGPHQLREINCGFRQEMTLKRHFSSWINPQWLFSSSASSKVLMGKIHGRIAHYQLCKFNGSA